MHCMYIHVVYTYDIATLVLIFVSRLRFPESFIVTKHCMLLIFTNFQVIKFTVLSIVLDGLTHSVIPAVNLQVSHND